MNFFKSIFKKAAVRVEDTAHDLAEPAQNVLNTVMISGIAAGIILGGAYVYKRVRHPKD